MADTYYVYLHKRKDTGEIFYVGKGQTNRAWRSDGRNEYWRKIAKKHGRTVEIIFYGTEDECFAVEKAKIRELRGNGVDLSNATDGGEGASGVAKSAECRAKQSATMRAKWEDPIHRARISEATKRLMSDPIEKEKVLDAMRAARSTPESRAKSAAAAKAYATQPDVIAKRRETTTSLWANPDYRAKVTAAVKSGSSTPEARLRKREAALASLRRRNGATEEPN